VHAQMDRPARRQWLTPPTTVGIDEGDFEVRRTRDRIIQRQHGHTATPGMSIANQIQLTLVTISGHMTPTRRLGRCFVRSDADSGICIEHLLHLRSHGSYGT
jgi:hypothetical protein